MSTRQDEQRPQVPLPAFRRPSAPTSHRPLSRGLTPVPLSLLAGSSHPPRGRPPSRRGEV